MNWEVLITILGTILGSQTVTEIIRWLKNRKTDSRIEEAHADSEELNAAIFAGSAKSQRRALRVPDRLSKKP